MLAVTSSNLRRISSPHVVPRTFLERLYCYSIWCHHVESNGVGETLAYLERKAAEYLKKMEYSSRSPDLNPLTYPVRAEFSRVVYGGGEIDYLADLRYHIAVAGQNLSMTLVQKAVAEHRDSI